MKKYLSLLASALLLSLCFSTAALAAEAGVVLRVTPGAWAEREGKRVPLDMRSTVMTGDTLVTDVTGRLQVLFTDDTTISLGADTQVAVASFVFGGKESSFVTEMPKGAARFVTGKIVEQNRDGFKVTTPQATVGIRGTTFSVSVSGEGVTSVVGLDVSRAFPLSVTNAATGAMTPIDRSGIGVDATPSGNKTYEVPEGHFSQASAAVNGEGGESGDSGGGQAASGLVSTALAGGDAASGGDGGMSSAASGMAGAGGASALAGGLYGNEPAMAQALATSAGMTPMEALQSMGTGMGMGGGPDHSNASGHYTGALRTALIGLPAGTFSFDALLSAGTGSITNTQMSVNSLGHSITASQVGGPASVSGGSFSTILQVNTSSDATVNVGNAGHMSGSFGAGNSVSGTWGIENNSSGNNLGQSGSFQGSKN